MFGQDKNLTNNIKDTSPAPAPSVVEVSYTKTNKLITALYMVTDMMDRDEPLRNKLRTLGTEIISDMFGSPFYAVSKIDQIMSFLDIASAINIISQMNAGILKKEFTELAQSIRDFSDKVQGIIPRTSRDLNLTEFFAASLDAPHPNPLLGKERGSEISKGHTRLGLQKGGTLMNALSDRNMMSDRTNSHDKRHDFEIQKKERRFNIVNAIKAKEGSATIKDIYTKINNGHDGVSFCSEKTLQRELMSMIKDGVLTKTGEKRWSRYSLAK